LVDGIPNMFTLMSLWESMGQYTTTKKIQNIKFSSFSTRTQHTKASNLRLVLESFEVG